MPDIPAWLDIAVPRRDIADGSFDESVFAADLGLVAEGTGPSDYLDPVRFFEKTYLTDSLGDVLIELTRRLSGDSAAPGVYRLQTEFGGGKTHTLLAAYHLYRDPKVVANTEFVRELSAQLREVDILSAAVTVLDGSSLIPADPDQGTADMPEPGVEIHTLLGYLAYRLGGKESYNNVAAHDRAMAGTSTTQLVRLLEEHTPCLILLDEMLEYLNKALSIRTHDGNLAATTLTIIKELCTAAANVPGAAVVATLTSSRLEDYATVQGQEMQERLSKVVGRTENIVTPVEGDDIFPILHRRLFETVGDIAMRRKVANAYADYYETLGDSLPSSYQESEYRERLAHAFPFHPELVDILTNRWGSLSGFQRTRGALRTLAHAVKALAQRQHKAPLIHPGDVVFADSGVRAEVIRFAGESYKAALNADIIREDSKAAEEDRRRGGQVEEVRLATGLATTAFLNSFGSDRVLGASAAQMLVGVARPGLSKGLINDVRDSLEGLLWYMRFEGGRYRFTTEPNLNKVVLEREGAIGDDIVAGMIRDAVREVGGRSHVVELVANVVESADVPDDMRLTLGVMDFRFRIGREETEATKALVKSILEQRGSAWRANKNVLMLMVADGPAIAKARASARTLAALRDLGDDSHRLNRFNAEQREQLSKRLGASEQRLPQQVAMAYRHLLMLSEREGTGAALEHIDLGPARADSRLTDRVLDYLRSTDRIVESTLAPAALLASRFGLLPEGTDAVELDELLGYFAKLPRLPKLADPNVLRQALADGVARGILGLSSGSAFDAPDAVLRFKTEVDPAEIVFQPGTFLVRASAIATLFAQRGSPTDEVDEGLSQLETQPTTSDGESTTESQATTSATSHSHVRIGLAAVPGERARDVIKVAVLPLSASGAEVRLKLEIEAKAGPAGISRETLELVIKEGLRQLGLHADIEVDGKG